MKFEEAMIYFRKGKKIKRKEWRDVDYLHLSEAITTPNAYDLLADDWEIIYPPEVPKSFTRSQIIRAYSDALYEKGSSFIAIAGAVKLHEFDLNMFLKHLGFEEKK